MTAKRVILVEGREDKRVFDRLIEELGARDRLPRTALVVDTAEMLDSPEGISLGNREKVETYCAAICDTECGSKLLGFVDREFRGFIDVVPFSDEIAAHWVERGVVWSRGHSVENYFFEFRSLRDPLRDFTVSDTFGIALDLFERAFDSIVRLACAASLTGRDLGCLPTIKGSVDWSTMDLVGGEMVIVPSKWKLSLTRGLRVTGEMADEIVEKYTSWLPKMGRVSQDVLRWMCHGHIGLVSLWCGYTRCVFEATGKDPGATSRVLAADERVRFNACAEAWIRRVMDEGIEAPLIVLERFGLASK